MLGILMLAMGTAATPLPPSRCLPQAAMTIEVLLSLASQCGNRREFEDLVIQRTNAGASLDLATLFREKPELRRAILSTIVRMGSPGQEIFGQLGADGVRTLIKADLPEGARLLRSIGLQGMLARDPHRTVRSEAAAAVASIAPERAVPRLLALLGDASREAEERGVLARLLAGIDDPRALDGLVVLLADSKVERWIRWDVAQELRRSGRPRAVAAARRYAPSGRQGSGNPDSPLGTLLALLTFGGSLGALLAFRGTLSRELRVRLVLVASIAPYCVVLFGLPFYVTIGMMFRGATYLVIATILAVASGLALRSVRVRDLLDVSIVAMSAATSILFMLGIALELKVNWYLDRATEAYGFLKSPLLLGLTLSGALAGSYVRALAGRRAE